MVVAVKSQSRRLTPRVEAYAHRNSDYKARLKGSARAGEGKYKYIQRGLFAHSLQPCVAKFLKSGATFSSECFQDDVENAERALPIIAEFHEAIASRLPRYASRISIKINVPGVWTQETGGPTEGQRCLVEPFVDDFKKFNSNSGAADVTANVAQSLSHFSYHVTGGRELLCDLQGGRDGGSYILSDVVIMSADRRHGLTDLGLPGIENFFSNHVCTPFCCPAWKTWTGAKRRFPPVMATTLTLDVAGVPAPLRPRTYERLLPSQINFVQGNIKDRFQDGRTLLQTALEVASMDISKYQIPMMKVVIHDGRWKSLDNRRLAVFRLLEMCSKVHRLKIEIVPFVCLREDFESKWDGGCGDTIRVRQGGYVIGATESKTTVPRCWLVQIRDALATYMPTASEFQSFLGTLYDV